MSAPQCRDIYHRIDVTDDGGPTYIRCTYIEGHTTRHSWETLKQTDDAERVDRAADLPIEVERHLMRVRNGHLDPYLEVLLSETHARKLALRGARGFPSGKIRR
jgi:hypothetical protein